MPENAHVETVPRETPTAKPAPKDRFLGLRITPIMRRRLANFAHNRRGFWSLWIFPIFPIPEIPYKFSGNFVHAQEEQPEKTEE